MGGASGALLHRRLRAADRLRLSLAGAADQRRRADEPRAAARHRLRAERAAATPSCRRCPSCWWASAAGSWACARWSRTSSPRITSTYAELGRGEPPPHPDLLCDAQRARAADHRARAVARRDLQRRDHHRAGVRLSRHRHAARRCRACRRLQPGARHHVGFHRRGLRRRAADRPALSAARSRA